MDPPRRGEFSAAERAAARTVSSNRRGHVFELQLGHLCNNRCVFCSSGRLTEAGLARPVDAEAIFRALDEARASGARRVVFLGGEPTLHRHFLDAVRHAVRIGFEDLVLFTDGVTLPRPGFVEAVAALGRFEWRISIQGATEAAHVAVTRRPASFRRIVAGLEKLSSLGQRITANVCVTRENAASLPGYPALVERYGIRQLHVDIVRPESTGLEDLSALGAVMPRYSELAPHLDAMLRAFEARALDVEVRVGNLPYCVLPEWPAAIHHGGEETVTVASDTEGLEAAVDKYGWHRSLRTHLPQCEHCALRRECTGVFRAYLARYGDGEFRPVALEAVEALPPARRPFGLLLAHAAAAWLAAAGCPPRPWVLRGREEDRRSRAWTYAQPAGAGWITVRLLSPEQVAARPLAPDGAPVVHRDRHVAVALVVDPEVPPAARMRLIAFVGRHLGFDPRTALLQIDVRHRTLGYRGPRHRAAGGVPTSPRR